MIFTTYKDTTSISGGVRGLAQGHKKKRESHQQLLARQPALASDGFTKFEPKG